MAVYILLLLFWRIRKNFIDHTNVFKLFLPFLEFFNFYNYLLVVIFTCFAYSPREKFPDFALATSLFSTLCELFWLSIELLDLLQSELHPCINENIKLRIINCNFNMYLIIFYFIRSISSESLRISWMLFGFVLLYFSQLFKFFYFYGFVLEILKILLQLFDLFFVFPNFFSDFIYFHSNLLEI